MNGIERGFGSWLVEPSQLNGDVEEASGGEPGTPMPESGHDGARGPERRVVAGKVDAGGAESRPFEGSRDNAQRSFRRTGFE